MNSIQKLRFPLSLPYEKGIAMFSGVGLEPNTARYFSHQDGRAFTVAAGVIVSTGPAFSVASLPFNSIVGTVQIHPASLLAGHLNIGSHVLVILSAGSDARARAGAG